MPLYFAYGANMDTQAMARRCPKSKPLGVARLERFRFCVMPNGWGSVRPAPRRTVHGVLWDLALSDVRPLDAFEELGKGRYAKSFQPVIKDEGGSVRAMIYIGKGEGGCARPDYIAAIATAARAWSLPAAYIAELESHAAAGAPPSEGALEPSFMTPRVRPRFATPFDRR